MIRASGVGWGERQPVVLAIGPYFAHIGMTPAEIDPLRSGPNLYYKELIDEGKLFERGYTLVQVDLRGFGASEGCNDFGGKGEQADVKAAVEWAAAQPWSSGKVGMFGKSYDGWTIAMALATKPKGLAAAVIQAPILSAYRSLYMNGVHYALGWYTTPLLYQSTDALPPTPFDSPAYVAHSALGLDPACYAQNIALQTALVDRDDRLGFWQERDLIPRAAGSTVPTLWEHGFLDANAKPDNFLDVYSTLRGPHRLWAGQWPHDRPTEALIGRKGFYDESMRWFDRYLKGAAVADDPGAEIEDGGTQTWRAEAQWPPADTTARDLVVRSRGWSVSPPLPYDVHLAGTPQLKLDVGSSGGRAYVFARVFDIDRDGRAQLLTRGAFAVTHGGPIAFDLYPQDWTFKAGHRIGLELPGDDPEWFLPLPSLGTASVSGGTLSLPFLRHLRTGTIPGARTQAEKERPEPPDVSGQIAGAQTAFDVPPAMAPPTVKVRRLDRRRVRVSATGAPGATLHVRVLRGSRTVAMLDVAVGPSGTWRMTLRIARHHGQRVRALLASDR